MGKDIKAKAMKAMEDEEASGAAVARFVEKAVAASLVDMLVSPPPPPPPPPPPRLPPSPRLFRSPLPAR